MYTQTSLVDSVYKITCLPLFEGLNSVNNGFQGH